MEKEFFCPTCHAVLTRGIQVCPECGAGVAQLWIETMPGAEEPAPQEDVRIPVPEGPERRDATETGSKVSDGGEFGSQVTEAGEFGNSVSGAGEFGNSGLGGGEFGNL